MCVTCSLSQGQAYKSPTNDKFSSLFDEFGEPIEARGLCCLHNLCTTNVKTK